MIAPEIEAMRRRLQAQAAEAWQRRYPRCSCPTYDPLALWGVYDWRCPVHAAEISARSSVAGNQALDAVQALVQIRDRGGDLEQCVSEVLVRLLPWLGGRVDAGTDRSDSGRIAGSVHEDSPSVGPVAGTAGADPTVGEGDGAGRDDSPPAAPSPVARMGTNSQRLYALLDLLSDAAYRVQATLTEDRPAEVFRTEFEHLSTITKSISDMSGRWQS